MKKIFFIIFAFIRNNIFLSKYFRKYGETAVSIMEMIKEFINSEMAETFVKSTENKIDDAVLLHIRKVFALVFQNKTVLDASIEEALEYYMKKLKELSKIQQQAIYLKISSLLVQELAAADSLDIKTSEADALAQLSYLSRKEGLKV